MKPNSSIFVVLPFIIITWVSLAHAADTTKEEVIGKWKEIGGSETMEFFSNKTIIVKDGPIALQGNYKFMSHNQIKVKFRGFVGSVMGGMSISIEDKILHVKASNGKLYKYEKIR